MKFLLIFSAIIILFHSSSCQTKSDSYKKSRKIEIEGWELLFIEKFDSAKIKFKESQEICDTNYHVYLGFAVIKGMKNNKYFDDIEKACNGNNELMWSYTVICSSIIGYLQTSKKNRIDNDDFNTIKAMLTDGKYIERLDSGNIRTEGQFKNNKESGIWKYYDMDGKVYKTTTYSDTSNIYTYKWYKSDGDIISEESWESTDINTGSSTKIKEVVYWQEVPGKSEEYLFVSTEGFCTYDKGKSVILDETTPDNIIVKERDKDYLPIWYIWKNGKKEIYKACDYDGVRFTIMQGLKKGTYVWKNCEMILENDK